MPSLLSEAFPVKIRSQLLAAAALMYCAAASLCSAQDGNVTPNENLVVEGIPAIPASLAESIDRYGNYRGAGLASWHPSKREMLISTRFSDVNQVHSVRMPGGERDQLTFYPDPVNQAHYQPTDGNYFVFSKDVGGGEFYQLYRYELGTGDITLPTDGKSRNTGMVWSYAGDKVAYGSTRRTGKDVDLYIMNPRDPKSDRLLAKLEGGGWQALDWSPDGHKLLVAEEVSANESYLWV